MESFEVVQSLGMMQVHCKGMLMVEKKSTCIRGWCGSRLTHLHFTLGELESNYHLLDKDTTHTVSMEGAPGSELPPTRALQTSKQ